MVRKIAILTSGGDAPGMNAALRVCIRAGLFYGKEMYVIYDGFKGLVDGDIHQVNKDFTADIINRGGTILRSYRLPEFCNEEVQLKAVQQLKDYEIDAVIGIGGDGTYRGLAALKKHGVNVIGLPATIDNDVASTDYTIGFITALNTICDCIDKIKDTSSSHQRCSIIEVMGRHCGDLAMFSSIAEAAEMTITYDYRVPDEVLFRKLRKLKAQKKSHAIIVVSENLLDVHDLSKRINEETGFETRVEILGRLQRGGSPSAFDRILASRLGSYAIETLNKGEGGVAIGYIKGETVAIPLEEATTMKRDTHKTLINLIDMLQ
ncbi:MAG: 6-phosphofructokinase [Bacilli bacterium]|nr:6-phosphofructokinase [Bacilli bacterium]